MVRRAIFVTGFIAALSVVAATLSATTLNRTTYFVFNKAVHVGGVLLPAGDYAFEIANPNTSANVVKISNRKRSKVYVTALTRPVIRPTAKRLDAVILFGEAGPAEPRPIRVWYPEGVTTGYEFLR